MIELKLREYVNKKGSSVNQEIKNNIYILNNCMIRNMLIEYLIDLLENYDYRVCNDSFYKSIPLITENNYIELLSEDSLYSLLSEIGETLMSEETELEMINSLIITENGTGYLELEGDYNKFMHDKNFIKSYIRILTKNTKC